MSMLAERKQKQKWALSRNVSKNNNWSNDTNKIGQKMMERMGWTEGKGLGRSEDGLTENIKLHYKCNNNGMGFKDSVDWSVQQDNFKTLLEQLGDSSSTKTDAHEIKSLEEKSKKSGVRVHYKKFTRGKDLSRYSEKDLANIFGKKKMSAEKELKSESDKDETSDGPTFGVQTTSGGSMVDYFRSKKLGVATKNSKTVDHNESVDDVTYGFGFKNEWNTNEDGKKKKKSKNKTDTFVSYLNTEDTEIITEVPSSKKRKIDDDVADISTNKILKFEESPRKIKKSKKSKKESYENVGCSNPAFDPLSKHISIKKRPLDTITENDDDDVVNNSIVTEGKKKIRKEKKVRETSVEIGSANSFGEVDNPIFNASAEDGHNNSEFEVKRKKKKKKEKVCSNETTSFDNPNFNINAEDKHSNLEKFEIKLKKKKKNRENPGLDNPCLNLAESSVPDQIPSDGYEVKRKSKKKLDKTDCKDESVQSGIGNTEISDSDIMLNVVAHVVSKAKPTNIGIVNGAFDANAQIVEESVNSLTKTIDSYQAEVENGINETKLWRRGNRGGVARNSNRFASRNASEQYYSAPVIPNVGELNSACEKNEKHQEGVKLCFKDAQFDKRVPAWLRNKTENVTMPKKAYKHLIKGDIIVTFKNSNLDEVNGYGVQKTF